MNNNTSSSSPILFSNGGGVLNSGKIKIQGTSGKNYNLDNFTTVSSCPFPVGFGGFFQIDPNTIYAGTTWAQKKDVFILASGTVYPVGSTGGEAVHTLTVEEMPSHNHNARTIGATSDVNIAKSAHAWLALRGANNSDIGLPDSITYTRGGDKPHNNMPPYYAMPFWIRTA